MSDSSQKINCAETLFYVKITTYVLVEKCVTILKENIRCCFFNYNIIFVEKERHWTQYQKFCIIICFILLVGGSTLSR